MNYKKRLMSTLFVTCAAMMSAHAEQTATVYMGKMTSFIPQAGEVSADIMVLGFSPEVSELVDRVQNNVKDKQEWFKDYVSELQPEAAVPYHENFGVDEYEYQRLLNGTKEAGVIQAGQTNLKFKLVLPDETLRISGLPGESPFDSVVYEPVSDSMMSSYGVITKSTPAEGRLGNAEESAWAGRVWTMNRKEVDNQVIVTFVMGKLVDQEKHVLIHEVKGVINNAPMEYHYMLVWDAQ